MNEAPAEDDQEIIKVGSLIVDISKMRVFKKGKPVDLSQREYDLVKYMAKAPGKVFVREELMTEVWNYDYFGDVRLVDTAMRRLRKKLEDDPANPEYIITKYGGGYYLNANT
jgi:two-component system response regulator VicR